MVGLEWDGVSARRLRRSGLLTALDDPADVVAALCGAHAQVMSAAELSIGLRLDGATRADVRDALWVDRTLIKTRGPRGTVHVLPARDLPMWTGALSALPPSRLLTAKDSVLTPEQAEQVVEGVAAVLDGEELTTEELSEALADKIGSWAADPVMEGFQQKWPRWVQAMDLTAYRGALCFGPNRGRKVTYTSPRRWLPGFEPADAHTALSGLVRAYLHSFGPSTPQHFAKWLATPKRWATEVFDSLADELEEVEFAGERAWVVAGDTDVPASAPRGVRLLPYFDSYTIACQPRELLFPGAAAQRALAGGQAGNFPLLLIDGVVAGVWHQRRSGKKLHITVEPIGTLKAAHRRALDEEVARVGHILEGKPELTIGTITVGAHA
jgi:hypothetical protein